MQNYFILSQVMGTKSIQLVGQVQNKNLLVDHKINSLKYGIFKNLVIFYLLVVEGV